MNQEPKQPRHTENAPRKQGLFADIKNDVVAAGAELIATVLFLLFAFGAVQVVSVNLQSAATAEGTGTTLQGSDGARISGYYYISAAFGLSLFAVATVFYRFSGSLMNPSVGLSLMLVGAIKPVRFLLTATAQMVGGIVAAAILDGLTPGPLAVAVSLGNGTNRTQGLFIEAFATAGLVLSVLFLAAEKHRLTPFAPLGFGFMLFVVELFSVPFTGGAVNTARAFGPACISGFDNYHWIYWLGPTLGSLTATGVYYLAKHLHYWEVNPNQDSTDHRHAPDITPRNSHQMA